MSKRTEDDLSLLLYDSSLQRELPSGRRADKQVSRADVATSQRVRLLEAVMEEVAERGYANATVAGIASRAGVSSRTFYVHFKDKEACFLESYDQHATVIFRAMASASSEAESWGEAVRLGTYAYLSWCANHPAWAKAYAVGVLSASEPALKKRYDSDMRFARLYRGLHENMRAADPRIPELTDEVVWTCISFSTELVRQKVRNDGPERLPELLPTICGVVYLLLGSPLAPADVTADSVTKMLDLWHS